MKLNKWTLALFALLALIFTVPSALAQNTGLYSAIGGGAVVIPAGTTNKVYVYTLTNGVPNGTITTNTYGNPGTATNLTLNVQDYDYAGLVFTFTGTATSTNDLLVYRSYDNGATYEANAGFSYTGLAPGAATYVTNALLDVRGVSRLAFVIKSAGTTYATNAAIKLNLKAARLQTSAAGLNNSGGVGTPIAVPNFP